MKIICLEEHMSTDVVSAAWRRQDPQLADPVMHWTVAGSVAAPLADLGAGRIHAMDIAGIDISVLSLTTPGLQDLPPDDAVALQHPTNDAIAAAINRYPDRLQGFATLATSSPATAARELSRAIGRLGLNGAMLHSLSRGEFLDDGKYWEIFEAAEHHRVPLYLHPSVPPQAVDQAYYEPFGLLGTGGAGWHYQTGLSLLRLILAGVLDRFPKLQLIVGHWGEMVLFFLERSALLDNASKLKRPLIDYFTQNVFVTPGGIASHRYLRWAMEVLGAERIMHATDYPFNGSHDFAARQFLLDAEISDDAREKIAFANWEKLIAGIVR